MMGEITQQPIDGGKCVGTDCSIKDQFILPYIAECKTIKIGILLPAFRKDINILDTHKLIRLSKNRQETVLKLLLLLLSVHSLLLLAVD